MPRGQAINSSTEAAKAEELLFNMTVRDTILNVQEGYYALFSEISYLESLESDYRENVDQLKQAEAKYLAKPTFPWCRTSSTSVEAPFWRAYEVS